MTRNSYRVFTVGTEIIDGAEINTYENHPSVIVGEWENKGVLSVENTGGTDLLMFCLPGLNTAGINIQP